ncbi:MAG: hypothetical protein OXF41_05175 [bacterium]|nr:hypothetical protein [bacterium]
MVAALGLSDDPNLLDAGRIGDLFGAVNAGLGGVGLQAPVEVVVVGGAAIAMQWNPGRATYDVDVVSEGIPAVLWDVVADVGRAEGLDAEWLNAAARVKAPTGPTPGEPTAIYVGSHLRVYGASPHYVLAMKLLTGRGVDLEDIPVLLDVVQPTSRDELYDLVERAYPTAQIPASARYIIEQSWDTYAADRPDRGQSGAGERRAHRVSLSVQPALARTDGWDMAIRSVDGSELRRSALYPTREDAEAAARFAVDVVDVHYPLHFAGGVSAPEAAPEAVTVNVVSSGEEHRLVAAAPDGELVAYSDPYTSVAAASTLAFVEALSHMVGDPRGRRAMHVDVDTACDCPALRKGPCRHHRLPTQRLPLPSREASSRNPETVGTTRPDTIRPPLGGSTPLGVRVQPFTLDNHGWEVATTDPDGTPRQLSGPHPTVEEAEASRDFMVRLVNVHPRLHIPGSTPQRSAQSDVGSAAAPHSGEPPTVGLYSPAQTGRWYVQCRNPDNTVNDSSPPYPTRQAATTVLAQIGWLSVATTARDIGHRAVAEPPSSSCPCSLKGWRCEHIEPPAPEPPDRGHGLSL